MKLESLIASLTSRGIQLIPDGSGLIVKPASKLTDAEREAIRQHATEIRATISPKEREPGRSDGEHPLASSLITIADAIAAAPRSPVLNDLALSKAAAAFVVSERAIQTALPALRAEIERVRCETISRAASEIRLSNYRAAYDTLDALPDKLREFSAQ
jgi:hypothetical protein